MPTASSLTGSGSNQLAEPLLALFAPAIESISTRLIELQEAQHLLITTANAQRADISEGNSDWLNARAVLDRIPEYQAKVARLRKAMAATQALIVKTDKSSSAIRAKLEEKEAQKQLKRSADATGYSSVKT